MNRPSHASLLVRNVLEETGVLVRNRMEWYLAASEPEHEVYRLASEYPRRAGRMLRASLCLASARAHGAQPEEALNTAVSLELLHNAFLVHDDIEDEGEERRGLPTLHRKYGVPVALNVGDALSVLSLRPLMDNRQTFGARLAFRIFEETQHMARESVEGQAMELGWRADNACQLDDEHYLQMILKKTCWYTTIHPLRMGALIGSRDRVNLDAYVRLGFFLGAAFQIQDDVLNLIGDAARYGKELHGDLAEGKRTLMLLHVLRNATPAEHERLRTILSSERAQRRANDVRWMLERIEAHDSIEYARRVAHGLAGAALHEFARAFDGIPACRESRFIEALALWMLERT